MSGIICAGFVFSAVPVGLQHICASCGYHKNRHSTVAAPPREAGETPPKEKRGVVIHAVTSGGLLRNGSVTLKNILRNARTGICRLPPLHGKRGRRRQRRNVASTRSST